MFVFPCWTRLVTPEHNDRKMEEYDDRVIQHLVSLRDHYVPGFSHFWR